MITTVIIVGDGWFVSGWRACVIAALIITGDGWFVSGWRACVIAALIITGDGWFVSSWCAPLAADGLAAFFAKWKCADVGCYELHHGTTTMVVAVQQFCCVGSFRNLLKCSYRVESWMNEL